MPGKQNFNYLEIRSAEQVNKLIQKCQDSLDKDFIKLYQAKGIFEKMISNQFKLPEPVSASDINCDEYEDMEETPA